MTDPNTLAHVTAPASASPRQPINSIASDEERQSAIKAELMIAAERQAEERAALLVEAEKLCKTPTALAADFASGYLCDGAELDAVADKLKRGGPDSKGLGAMLAALLAGRQIADLEQRESWTATSAQMFGLARRIAEAHPKGRISSMVRALEAGLKLSGFNVDAVGNTIAEAQARVLERAEARNQKRKSKVQLNVDDLDDDLVDAVIENIAADPALYQRHGYSKLVHVTREAVATEDKLRKIFRPAGAPTIRTLQAPTLEEVIRRRCEFFKRGEKDETVRCAPPGHLASTIAARGEWSFVRPLRGVVDYPVMRPDGSILSAQGYDPATLYLCENKVALALPDAPTREHAEQALAGFRWLLSDFPFENRELGLAVWLSGLLTLLARPAIAGPVPLLLVDANESGSGKSLLVKLLSLIVFGTDAPMRSIPSTEEEWRKVLFSVALAGDNFIVLDNVNCVLRSAALDVALTSNVVADRALGTNDDRKIDLRGMFAATMNNGSISRDLVRRTIHCRLLCDAERPESRDGFKILDIESYVLENRATILSSAFCILRAFGASGAAPKLRNLGSFEKWSRVVRAPLAWLGLPDVASSQEALRDESDIETQDLNDLLQAWFAAFGDAPVTARQLVQAPSIALSEQLKGMAGLRGDDRPTASRVGYLLRKHRDRRAGGLALRTAGVVTAGENNDKGAVLWAVSRVELKSA